MIEIAITQRPIVLEAPASASMLTDILNRIATIRGRASAWGVINDVTLAEGLTGGGFEADFTRDYYRRGFVEGAAPAILPGWAYSGGGGTSLTSAGAVQKFAVNTPRITDRGLLIEQALTNILLQSEDFTTTWANAGASAEAVVANDRAAPDGTTTADKITGRGNNNNRVQQVVTLAGSSVYTVAVCLRNVDSLETVLHVECATKVPAATITWSGTDIATLIGTNGATAGSLDLAGGWKLVWITFGTASGDAGSATVRLYPSSTADSVARSIHAWGADMKEVNRRTAYIPTTTSAATRAVDAATLTLPQAMAYPVTVLVEFERSAVSGTTDTVLYGRGPDANEAFSLFIGDANTARVNLTAGGVGQAALNFGTVAVGERHLFAARFRADDVRAALDGDLSTADASAVMPSRLQMLGIGASGFGGDEFEGWIRRVVVLSGILTDAQLQIATGGS
jgi:hypothetical protein